MTAEGASSPRLAAIRTTSHRLERFDVLSNASLAPLELSSAVARVADPGRATETLHWGRNYLYTMSIATVVGRVEVVVKQFRNQGLVARLKRRVVGSKASRSWRAACELIAAGVPTPSPVLLLESIDPEGPSLYVSEKLSGVVESRYIFRALAAGTEREAFPALDRARLAAALGALCRKMHAAGLWHRDISIGNLLVRLHAAVEEPEVFIVDLNRARLGCRLGTVRRTRDLCRLPLPTAADRREFLSSYWEQAVDRRSLRYVLFWVLQQGFLLKNRLKSTVRRPVAVARDLVVGRQPHAHIPLPSATSSARDKIVWDRLSDQPHQHASRTERTRVRLGDVTVHGEALGAALAAAPGIWRRYRRLRRSLFQTPIAWTGAGIALRPRPDDPEGLLAALDETGVGRVLLRLHPWEANQRPERELAEELAGRGYEIAFALPQNRDLVKDLGRWTAAVELLAEQFMPFGCHFQIGQAINRSKWGVWNYREYLALAARASEVLRRYPNAVVLGPAVIDFELQATAAVTNMHHAGVYFDVLSSLLYVDRRGAPENRQLGFDTVHKAALVKAIAETGRNCGSRCWVTEVNWPLWEGPHSPAGRSVAVDEETQADYLVRYYLQILASGMIERVYWWRLIARGYGLVDPAADGSLRRRPSHRALTAMERLLRGTEFRNRIDTNSGAHLLRFADGQGRETVVGWSLSESVRVDLPRPVESARDRDGRPLPAENGEQVELTPRPRYFHLEQQ